MNIEEINKLINELEKTNEDYKKIVEKRKNIRLKSEIKANQKRKKRIKIITNSILLIITIPYLKQYFKNKNLNIYTGNRLKISQKEAITIEKKVEDYFNINLSTKDEYLFNSIVENTNLTPEEKQIVYNILKEILEDNQDVIKEETYYSLLNLNILDITRPFFEKNNILGRYIYQIPPNYKLNDIIIYEKDEETLGHEIIHSILMNDQNQHFPKFITEGITEILTNEYCVENPNVETTIYPYEKLMIKMLSEIISPEIIYKSYTIGDISLIYNALSKIDNELNPEQFINSIDILLASQNTIENISQEVLKIYNQLNKYFEQSPNNNKKSRKRFNHYLRLFTTIKNQNPYDSYFKMSSEEPLKLKRYFNK